jgi:hypothetical protein
MALGRRPDGDHASRLGRGDRDVGLEEALVGARHHVAPLDDDVGLGQPRRDVAAFLTGDGGDIARPDLGLGLGVPAAMDGDIVEALGALVEDPRCILFHRVERVIDGGQLGVVDDDSGGAVRGRGLRGGGDRRDRLAHVVDLLGGERLVGPGDVRLGQVAAGQHRHDARHQERLVRVDTHDRRARVGAEDELDVEQAVRFQVLGEERFAEELGQSVDAAGAASNRRHGSSRRHHGNNRSPTPWHVGQQYVNRDGSPWLRQAIRPEQRGQLRPVLPWTAGRKRPRRAASIMARASR